MCFNALSKPKTKSPNPIRMRYEKITRFSQVFLNVKNTQKHQFDYQYPTKIKPKIFTCFYVKCVGNVLKLFYHGSIRHYVSKIFA
ncbi:hypothetical protein F7201_05550 [Helicobacter pylori]|nr:hypothetical protein [Helicobacter pylori]